MRWRRLILGLVITLMLNDAWMPGAAAGTRPESIPAARAAAMQP